MNLLAYYVIHTIKNSIKKLFKSWVIFIFIIFLGFGMIGGIIGGIIGASIESSNNTQGEYNENYNYEDPFEFTEEHRATTMNILEIAAGGIILALLFINFYTGDKNGASIFTMPDVNFLFTAPLKPQSVLMFRVILQMGLIFMGSIYVIFQLPNLILNLGVSPLVAVFILLAWILALILGKLVSVCTYTVSATYPDRKKYIKPIALGIVGMIAITHLSVMHFGKMDAYTAAVTLYASKASRFVPVWGWLKGFVMYAVEGNFAASFLSLFGVLVSFIVFVYIIWHIKADFYEDALTNAAKKQEAAEALAAGKRSGVKRSEKLNREGSFNSGRGAAMFFMKSMYNRKRFSKFGVFTNTSISYLLICLAVSVLIRYLNGSNSIALLAAIILGMVYVRNYGNPIAGETEHNFIYMVPESPFKKLMYSLFAGTYDTCMDILPGFVVATVLIGENPFVSLCWFVLFISLDLLASSSGLFIELLLPTFLAKAIKGSLQVMLKLISIVPFIIILSVGAILSFLVPAILISVVVNFAIGAGIFAFCPMLLHSGRN